MKSRKILLLLILSVFLFTLAACAGEIGPQGPKGDTGAKGDTGQVGPKGDTGTQGPQGPKGDTGQTGQTGQNGKDGVDGKDGENGKDGADGKDGEVGPAGEPGKDGENGKDGADGKDGEDGKDGLSAYEIYLKTYPGYDGTEAEWLAELYSGQLFVTVVLNYKNDAVKYFSYMKGDKITGTNWFLDALFEKTANGTVLLDNVTEVFVNENYVGVPITMNMLTITSVNAGEKVFYAGGVEYTFATTTAGVITTILYDADSERYVYGGAQTITDILVPGTVVVDVKVTAGKVTSLRLASNDVEIYSALKQTNVVVVRNATTDEFISWKVDTYSTVQDVLDSLVIDHPQTWSVVKGTAAVALTSVVSNDFSLKVTAEDGVTTKTYIFAVGNLANTIEYELLVDDEQPFVLDINYISPSSTNAGIGSSIKVIEGTTIDEVRDALYPVVDSLGRFINPEFAALLTSDSEDYATWNDSIVAQDSQRTVNKTTALVSGDQIVVPYGSKSMYYYVNVVKDQTAGVAPKTANGKVTATYVRSVANNKIVVAYETKITDIFTFSSNVVDGLVSAELVPVGLYQFYRLVYTDIDGSLVHVENTGDVLLYSDYKLQVRSQGSNPVTGWITYSFEIEKSTNSAVTHITDAYISVAGNNISVVKGLKVSGLISHLKYAYDTEASIAYGETVTTETLLYQVYDSEGNVKNPGSRLYYGDKLVVVAPSVGTFNASAVAKSTYIINPNKVIDASIELVVVPTNRLEVEISGNKITINPKYYSSPTSTSTSTTTVADLLASLNTNDYSQIAKVHPNKVEVVGGIDTNVINLASTISGDLLNGTVYWLKLEKVDYHATNNPDAYVVYEIVVRGLSTAKEVQIVADADRVFVTSSGELGQGNSISVNYSVRKGNSQDSSVITGNDLLADVNFKKFFQYNAGIYLRETGKADALVSGTLAKDKTYFLKFKTQSGADAENAITFTTNTNNEIRKSSNHTIFEIDGSEIKVRPESVRGTATKLSEVINGINFKYNNQTFVVKKQIGIGSEATPTEPVTGTAEVIASSSYGVNLIPGEKVKVGENNLTVRYTIEVTSESGATAIYTIVVNAKSDVKTLNLKDNVPNVLLSTTPDVKDITVANGSTVADLLAVLDANKFFQRIEVLKNDGTSKTSGVLNDYNILKVTAQDGTFEEYIIKVATKVKDVVLVMQSKPQPSATAELAAYNAITINNAERVINLGTTSAGAHFVTLKQLLTYIKDSNGVLNANFVVKASNGTVLDHETDKDDILRPGTIIVITPANNAFNDAKPITYVISPIK